MQPSGVVARPLLLHGETEAGLLHVRHAVLLGEELVGKVHVARRHAGPARIVRHVHVAELPDRVHLGEMLGRGAQHVLGEDQAVVEEVERAFDQPVENARAFGDDLGDHVLEVAVLLRRQRDAPLDDREAPLHAAVRAVEARLAVAAHVRLGGRLELEIALVHRAHRPALAAGELLDGLGLQRRVLWQLGDAQIALGIAARDIGRRCTRIVLHLAGHGLGRHADRKPVTKDARQHLEEHALAVAAGAGVVHHPLHRLRGQAHPRILLDGAALLQLGLEQVQEGRKLARECLFVIGAGDHGGEHVVAIMPGLGDQPVLHAAILDQRPLAVGIGVFRVDDRHERQGVRQRRDL